MIVLPVYLVVDVSASLRGQPIDDLNQALAEAFDALARDSLTSEMLEISVITFSSGARIVLPLCPIREANAPTLTTGGTTSYSAALDQLRVAIEVDVARLRSDGKKVYRPLVFFFTDGQPTDPGVWEQSLNDLRALRAAPTILPIGIGPVDPRDLELLAGDRGTAFLAGSSDRVETGVAIAGMVASLRQSIVASGSGPEGLLARVAPPGWEPLSTPLL